MDAQDDGGKLKWVGVTSFGRHAPTGVWSDGPLVAATVADRRGERANRLTSHFETIPPWKSLRG
jgi:hypothetical protein